MRNFLVIGLSELDKARQQLETIETIDTTHMEQQLDKVEFLNNFNNFLFENAFPIIVILALIVFLIKRR